MDTLSVLILAAQCGPGAPAPVLAALSIAQTDGEPFAVLVGNKLQVPGNIDDAIQIAASGLIDHSAVSVGLAAMPTTAFDIRNISYSSGFSACRNLSIASLVLQKRWKQLGAKDAGWRQAAIDVAQDHSDSVGEFAKKFDAALLAAKQAEHELAQLNAAATAKSTLLKAEGNVAPETITKQDGSELHTDAPHSGSVMVFSQ